MLHIVNGDSVADKLRQGVVQGEVMAWREMYSAGPVFRNMAEKAARELRAGYLERNFGIPREEYLKIEEQEAILRDLSPYKEVVLWFEHDLFDQTMLCYLLHVLAGQTLGDTKLSLLCIGAYPGIEDFRGLGQLTVEQLGGLAGSWQPVGQGELELGSRMWEAYTSPDTEDHIRFSEEAASALPLVKAAFKAHLSRLPSVYNGLGRIEQETLEIVASGINAPYDLFGQAGGRLNILGMGDLEYWHHLKRISSEPYPLLHIHGLEVFPNFSRAVPSFAGCRITLTALGRKVLEGEEDWVALKGADGWYGGLHLEGRSIPWRWDTSSHTLTRM